MSARPDSKPINFGKSRKNENRGNEIEEDLQVVENSSSKKLEDSRDINDALPNIGKNFLKIIKTIDLNRYATKKTFSQGMLDIALLVTNASQLKYVLQVGRRHEFYTLMIYLISASIALQIVQGVICVFLGSSLNINKEQDQKRANKWNDICLSLMVITVAVNVVISVFEMRDIDSIVASAKNVN